MKYRNPIVPGFYADPSICIANGEYYMVTSTFEYLPAIPVLHSTDLVHWEMIGHVITHPEQMSFAGFPASEGLYAPTIRYHDGVFYVVCTNVTIGGNFYVTATDPRGPWSEPIRVAQSGIDPSLLFDDDGTVYFTSNGFIKRDDGHTLAFIQQSIIDIKTGELLTEPKRISYGSGGRALEAPHLYHIGKYYYLVCAEGGTDVRHMVTVFRSESPWGPFESCPSNPILTARDVDRPHLNAVGHADLFADIHGQYWAVFLCYRMSDSNKHHHLGRETGMAPIEWGEDGWPYMPSARKSPDILIDCPDRIGPNEYLPTRVYEEDDFGAQTKLAPKWTFIREFFEDYSFSENPGYLTIHGKAETLSCQATPAFIGRRQEQFIMESRATLDFVPQRDGEEAGLAVVCADYAWYGVMVTRRNGRRVLIVRRRVDDLYMETLCALPDTLALTDAPIALFLSSDRGHYYFGYYTDGTRVTVASGAVKLLSTEVNWGFTGVFVGMYSTGSGIASTAAAKFKNFIYEGTIEDR